MHLYKHRMHISPLDIPALENYGVICYDLFIIQPLCCYTHDKRKNNRYNSDLYFKKILLPISEVVMLYMY